MVLSGVIKLIVAFGVIKLIGVGVNAVRSCMVGAGVDDIEGAA